LGPVAAGRLDATIRGSERPANEGANALDAITLMLRDHASWLLPSSEQLPESSVLELLGSNARAAHEAFSRHGALFPTQIGTLLNLVPSQVDDVLGELAAAGLVTSDGYPPCERCSGCERRDETPHAAASASDAAPAGRWTLLRSPLLPKVEDEKRIENWCRLLLRRYGVMFRELIANDAAAPRWGELVRIFRRLEARGEIRYGRFVDGVAGAVCFARDHPVAPRRRRIDFHFG